MRQVSFSQRLLDTFDERKARNRRYSIRAFAKALNADHGTVAQVLRGVRSPTPMQIRDWSLRLGFSEVETMVYLATRSHDTPVQAAQRAAIAHAAAETLCLAREPMHLALLAHVRANGALPHLPGHAAAHGRSVDEAQMALARLLRLGWIVQGAGGTFREATGLAVLDAAAFSRFVLELSAGLLQPSPHHLESAQ